jgi:hypothetical protein
MYSAIYVVTKTWLILKLHIAYTHAVGTDSVKIYITENYSKRIFTSIVYVIHNFTFKYSFIISVIRSIHTSCHVKNMHFQVLHTYIQYVTISETATLKGTVSPVLDGLKMIRFNRAFPLDKSLDVLKILWCLFMFKFLKMLCLQNTSRLTMY